MTDTLTVEQIAELEMLLANPMGQVELERQLSFRAPALIAMAKRCLEQTEELDRANQICGHHLGDALFHQERAEKAETEAKDLRIKADLDWVGGSMDWVVHPSGSHHLYLGTFELGTVLKAQSRSGYVGYIENNIMNDHGREFPTEAIAIAAVEKAVREAIEAVIP